MPTLTLCYAVYACQQADTCLRARVERVDDTTAWTWPDLDGGACLSRVTSEAAAGLRLDQRAG